MKQLGLLSIILTWSALLFLITRWKGDKSRSFSLHATKNRQSYLFYLALFLVTLPMFYIFALGWYIPTLHLGWVAASSISFAVLCQSIAAFIPDTTGYKRTVHRVAAYGMAQMLMVIAAIVVIAGEISHMARLLSVVLLATMVTMYSLVVIAGKQQSRFLVYQATYVACFHAMILVTTYLR